MVCSESTPQRAEVAARASWMGCCSGKTAVQSSIAFSRAHERIEISDGGAKVTKIGGGKDRVAAVEKVMTEGRHFVEFTRESGDVLIGVMRPEFDVEQGNNCHKEEGHAFYQCVGGYKYPGGGQWSASTEAADGDRFGLLLDLEAGSLIVFKNDERLGMMAAGLTGSYCWATALYDKRAAVTIKALRLPKVAKAGSARSADDMTEDEAALAIQARVRSRATKAKADETRPAT